MGVLHITREPNAFLWTVITLVNFHKGLDGETVQKTVPIHCSECRIQEAEQTWTLLARDIDGLIQFLLNPDTIVIGLGFIASLHPE